MRWGAAVALAGLLVLPHGLATAKTQPPAADPSLLGEFVPASPTYPAPQVSFTDAAGKTYSLSDFIGTPVLVNLWATWCAPCRHEMPSLERLQERLGDKITIVAISEDMRGEKAVEPFVTDLGLKTLKTYLDPKSAAGHAFKIDGLPTSFLIDRQGRVLGQVVGEAQWDSPKMLAIIEPLLAKPDIVKTSFGQAHP